MASVRATLGTVLLGLVLLVGAFVLLWGPPGWGRPERAVRPVPTAPAVPDLTSPAPLPAPMPARSRSRGESDWAFFFRAGDTLSRMSDGAPLGLVVRLERAHRFPDGSAGPAYVVRTAEQPEAVFDADELERSARVEAIREIGRPPIGAPRK